MKSSIVSGAAVLLALAPTALSAGTAHVINNCGSGIDVFYASVSQNVGASMEPLPLGGYSEAYSKPNDGVSIKLSTSAAGQVDQFEFTWANGKISYDISHINGNPFEAWGVRITPSSTNEAGFPTCVVLDCPAGQATCADAYNNPDDVMTHVCSDNTDLTFELCPSGGAQTRSVVTSTQTAVQTNPQATTSVQTTTTPSAAPSAAPSWPGSGHWHGRQHARHLPKK